MRFSKKSIINIALVFLFVVFLLQIYVLLFTQNNNNNCHAKVIETKEYAINLIRKLNIYKTYQNDQLKIDNCTLYFENESFLLSDLVCDKPVLVLFYSFLNCTPCVDFAMSKINEHLSSSLMGERIVFIFSKDINARIPVNQYRKDVYVVENEQSLGLPIEKSNIPFIFILDDEMRVKHLFIPEKGMPGLTDEYLSVVRERFFSKQS